MSPFITKFFHERSGAAAAEFAIICLVFVGVLLGILDMSRLAWEHNQMEKACLVGARFAVVNNMAAPDLANACASAGLPDNSIPPVDSVNPNPVICDTTNCTGYGYDAAAFDAIVNEMSSITSLVNDPNVIINVKYEHIGDGLCANPAGPDVWPLTTVTMTDRQFTFTTPLISAVFGTPDLECSATLTGEDFTTCEDLNPDGSLKYPPC